MRAAEPISLCRYDVNSGGNRVFLYYFLYDARGFRHGDMAISYNRHAT